LFWLKKVDTLSKPDRACGMKQRRLKGLKGLKDMPSVKKCDCRAACKKHKRKVYVVAVCTYEKAF